MYTEPNKLVMIEGINKLGMYSSIVCPDDDSHDYIIIEELPLITEISPETIDYISSISIQKFKAEITFRFEHAGGESTKTKFMYKIKDKNSYSQALEGEYKLSEEIDIQEIIDTYARAIYEELEFAKCETIKGLKDRAIEKAKKEMLMDMNFFGIGVNYKNCGLAFDAEGQALAYINGFETLINKNNVFNLKLNGCISHQFFSSLKISKIEFFFDDKKLIIPNFSIISSKESLVSEYYIAPGKIEYEDNDRELECSYTELITDEESYYLEKVKHIISKEELYGSVDNSRIDTLFDDFVF